MWKCLRSLIPKSRVALPNTLHLNGQSYQDDILISNIFNDYLIKINSNNLEHNDVNNIIDTDPIKSNVNNQQNKSADSSKVFEFGQVDCDLVKKIILNLDISKSSGVDDISAKLIKHAGNEVVNTLTELVNLSLNQGKFPYKWKHAKIFPLFKIGDFNSMTTYRPISILPVVSKVMERIVHKQLYDYLVNNNVLSEAQFGFRPCHSTASALGALTESWLRSIDEGLIIGALFIDLRRAFDTVDSSILLIKLQKLGMSNNALSWFKSYLTNRKQHVVVREANSSTRSINLGVPQGSILGPLLFLIYIDDIIKVLKEGNVIMYADDTTLYVTGSSLNEMQAKLQNDLNSIHKWILDNKLSLNTDKTKFIVVGSKQKINSCNDSTVSITYDGEIIEQCKSIKCLGVMIDQYLHWHEQVNLVCRKVFAGLAMLKRIRPFVENETLKLLYNCLIQSQIDYCCEIWGNIFNIQTERIQLQKRAARMILKCSMYTRSKEMFSELIGYHLKFVLHT